MSMTIYTASPRAMKGHITDLLEADLVPYIKGPPGIGKSSVVAKVAEEFGMEMIDHRLSSSEPTDMSGLPNFVNGKARFAPFDELFPLTDTPLPRGKEGWVIFLDEFNHAHKQVQAASYKLILDRMVGQHKLHPRVRIVLAGNRDTDRANVNATSTALKSRVTEMEMTVHGFEGEWVQDVALPYNFDSRIIAYLSQYPSELMDFDPASEERNFCCPRTWEFMNRLTKGKKVEKSKMITYAGTITSGSAIKFVEFTEVFKDLVKVEEIIHDPENARLPTDSSIRWATISTMMEKVTDKNFGKLAAYANRFPLDFRVLFFRSVMVRQPALRHDPAFAASARSVMDYLRGA